MKPQRHVVTVGTRRIWYREAGPARGPAMLLLHGGGEDGRAWRWVLPRLARRFRVLAPDLPGSGESDLVRDGYAAGFYGRFATDFLKALEIPRAVLVGHSLGGLAAIQSALGGGEHVRALVLVDSAGLGAEVNPLIWLTTRPGIGDWYALLAATPPGQLHRLAFRAWGCFARPSDAPAGWYLDQLLLGLRPALIWDQIAVSRALIGEDGQREIVLDRLGELAVPTQVVWGECDCILPLAHGREAARRLRFGRLCILPGCGHTPHVEQPGPFAEAVEAFAATLDGS